MIRPLSQTDSSHAFSNMNPKSAGAGSTGAFPLYHPSCVHSIWCGHWSTETSSVTPHAARPQFIAAFRPRCQWARTGSGGRRGDQWVLRGVNMASCLSHHRNISVPLKVSRQFQLQLCDSCDKHSDSRAAIYGLCRPSSTNPPSPRPLVPPTAAYSPPPSLVFTSRVP